MALLIRLRIDVDDLGRTPCIWSREVKALCFGLDPVSDTWQSIDPDRSVRSGRLAIRLKAHLSQLLGSRYQRAVRQLLECTNHFHGITVDEDLQIEVLCPGVLRLRMTRRVSPWLLRLQQGRRTQTHANNRPQPNGR
ncbi:hypothetical protein CU103_06505 [Phyllobacterium sophorae]|uniref:Uncharacterized protein n=1 Tax=Phyllobacterium sophorae TaxID=1520277 RepID=A0A2P7BIC2_9HYPH|nr:hypothetical protein CU103_06505 [Phyllobacterium sophorae]